MTGVRVGSATDVGRVRPSNQDAFLADPSLFAVADGMGGHAGGEVAARMVIDTLRSTYARTPSVDGLRSSINEANMAVWRQSQAQGELRGMGTTLTTGALVGDDIAVANVGDSRAYLFSDGTLTQITADHSVAEERVRRGDLTQAEAAIHPQRHILTRAMGISPQVDIDLWRIHVEPGDRLLLCSDGLTNELSPPEIGRILGTQRNPGDAASALVKAAVDHGGHDNVTVVVIDVVAGDASGSALAATTDATSGTSPAHRDDVEDSVSRKDRRRLLGLQRRITLRVVGFFLAIAVLVLAGYGFVWWYSTQNWYVTIEHHHLVIYQGRPGGMLWFSPKLVVTSPVTVADILPAHVAALSADVEETSLSKAKSYVNNLHREFLTEQDGNLGGATTPTFTNIDPFGTPTTPAPATSVVAPPAKGMTTTSSRTGRQTTTTTVVSHPHGTTTVSTVTSVPVTTPTPPATTGPTTTTTAPPVTTP